MKILPESLVFTALLGCSVALTAQPIPRTTPQDKVAAQVIQNFGRCAARVYRDRSLRLLETEPGSRAAQNNAEIISHNSNDCLEDEQQLIFHQTLLRGALAEGLYLEEFKAPPLPWAHGMAPLQTRVFSDPDTRIDAQVRQRNAVLHGYAACIAAANPASLHVLVKTQAWSKAEGSAFAALGDALTGCLPQGERIQMTRVTLRSALAEALYLYARKQRTGASLKPDGVSPPQGQ